MQTETKTPLLDRVMFMAAVVLGVAFAGAAIGLFINAYRMSVANAAAPLEAESAESYREAQAKLLDAPGWADDRALGGEAGESKRAEKLGFKRTTISDAMASVTKDLSSGAWKPVALTEEQLAVLDRLDMGGVTPEMILAAVNDPKALEAGKAVFTANCVACHGAAANGLVGPNLTDNYYLHGYGPTNVYKVITKGVAAKGMPPWGFLGEEKIKQVVAYVLSLEGKNVEGKAPQGVDKDGNPPPGS